MRDGYPLFPQKTTTKQQQKTQNTKPPDYLGTYYLHKAHRMKRRQGEVVKNPQISDDVVYERPPFAIAHGSE